MVLWILEFQVARDWVATNLTFAQSRDVQVFEIIIRALGGLLSAFHLSNDVVFLTKAVSSSVADVPFVNDRMVWVVIVPKMLWCSGAGKTVPHFFSTEKACSPTFSMDGTCSPNFFLFIFCQSFSVNHFIMVSVCEKRLIFFNITI